MRSHILAAAIAAVVLPAAPAVAQTSPREASREYREDVREARRDYRQDVREARQDRREDRRDWRRYRSYDWNRLPRGQRAYYADEYYRDGSYYRERRLTRADRIYTGRDGRYYCRRSDGTTGLIVGGIAGGLFGNALSSGRSATLGTLLGAGVGAALGSSIDRGNVRCR